MKWLRKETRDPFGIAERILRRIPSASPALEVFVRQGDLDATYLAAKLYSDSVRPSLQYRAVKYFMQAARNEHKFSVDMLSCQRCKCQHISHIGYYVKGFPPSSYNTPATMKYDQLEFLYRLDSKSGNEHYRPFTARPMQNSAVYAVKHKATANIIYAVEIIPSSHYLYAWEKTVAILPLQRHDNLLPLLGYIGIRLLPSSLPEPLFSLRREEEVTFAMVPLLSFNLQQLIQHRIALCSTKSDPYSIPFTQIEIVHLLSQLCAALSHLEESGIFYQDLNAANIFLEPLDDYKTVRWFID
jgi:hypothetical protein